MLLSIVVWDCYVHGILQSIDWKGENPKINLHSLFVKEIFFFLSVKSTCRVERSQ